MISNLAQLKKAVGEKRPFKILKHYVKPEYTGQVRTPNKVQSNGFYSIIADDLAHCVSLANGCKGSWIEFGKASDWTFQNGVCKQSFRGGEIWEIQFLDA